MWSLSTLSIRKLENDNCNFISIRLIIICNKKSYFIHPFLVNYSYRFQLKLGVYWWTLSPVGIYFAIYNHKICNQTKKTHLILYLWKLINWHDAKHCHILIFSTIFILDNASTYLIFTIYQNIVCKGNLKSIFIKIVIRKFIARKWEVNS